MTVWLRSVHLKILYFRTLLSENISSEDMQDVI